jgi:hypothetical protein
LLWWYHRCCACLELHLLSLWTSWDWWFLPTLQLWVLREEVTNHYIHRRGLRILNTLFPCFLFDDRIPRNFWIFTLFPTILSFH